MPSIMKVLLLFPILLSLVFGAPLPLDYEEQSQKPQGSDSGPQERHLQLNQPPAGQSGGAGPCYSCAVTRLQYMQMPNYYVPAPAPGKCFSCQQPVQPVQPVQPIQQSNHFYIIPTHPPTTQPPPPPPPPPPQPTLPQPRIIVIHK